KFRGKGEGIVEKLRYDKNESLVCFNQSQYFEGISTEVWDYQIGGYQVCHKWLKDRKGRTLSTDDIKQYCRIVTAIQKTIEIQKEIDDIYPQVEIDISCSYLRWCILELNSPVGLMILPGVGLQRVNKPNSYRILPP
ncbi:MAG: hypothetical protein JRH04_09790, partial [Deltaproteobacteria bacterium]|nr:hypothetical protein [Deltaproteobacteria bacterium]